jgi:hypothetical protein
VQFGRNCEGRKKFDLEVRWPSAKGNADVPRVLTELERLAGLIELEWRDIETAPDR